MARGACADQAASWEVPSSDILLNEMMVLVAQESSAGRGGARLLADVGGTNARFAYQSGSAAPLEHLSTLAVAAHPRIDDAIEAYLAGVADIRGESFVWPSHAAVAVATAVMGDHVAFTNSPWSFSQAELRHRLNLSQLAVLNDFEALALSLPCLTDAQLAWSGVAPHRIPPAHSMLAVVGPGTGLGVAGLRHTSSGWIALPTEGGHATLASHTPLEVEVLACLRMRYAHVSAERLLCGMGLELLHATLAQVHGRQALPASAENIVATALADAKSPHAETVAVFCGWLGSFCGSVALGLGARHGLFIGGGIIPRLGQRFFGSDFRDRFESKGRFTGYLSAIPTPVITDTMAALTGATAAI